MPRYCGEYYDAETGTIYLRARYYNPSTGRFISRDSFASRRSDPLSLNLYTYCHNNPIFYLDPTGHNAWTNFWNEFVDCWKVGSSDFREAWNVGNNEIASRGKVGELAASFNQGIVDTLSSQAESTVKTVRNPGKAIKKLGADYVSYGKKNPLNWNPTNYVAAKNADGIVNTCKNSYNLGLEYGANGVAYALGQSTTIVAETAVIAKASEMAYTQYVNRFSVPEQPDMMYVTRYGRPGLQPGDWVMPGKNTISNYIKSCKWQPGFGNEFAPMSSGQTFIVPKNTVKWPTVGEGLFESIVEGPVNGLFGQRQYYP